MRTITICIAVALVVFPVLAQVKNEPPDGFLNRQVFGDEAEYLPTSHAFSLSLSRAGVPGGMARIVNCKEEEPKQIWQPGMSSLRNVLDTLTIADPHYRWEIEEGLINLIPVAGEPTLLQTRISKFHITRAASGRDALNKLLALPEVKEAIEALDLKPGVALIVGETTPRRKDFMVRCKDVSLRQALNAIARAQGNGIWSYIEVHCDDKKTFVIRF